MFSIALVLAVIVFFGLIRFRLREMPLERDEGEYAYSGQLMLQGIPPYKLAYNMKLPGIYAAYAVILAVFGETPAGIHIGLLLVNAATTLLLFFLTARLFGHLAGIAAASSYAVLSTSSSVMGFEAHATNFVVLPALCGILLLLVALESERRWLFFLSGVLLGVAVLMKQHGIFFVLFCVFYLLWTEWKKRGAAPIVSDGALLVAGVVVPYAVVCLLLYEAGVFHEFWFWTFSYAGEYSKVGWHRAVRAFLENARTVAGPAVPIWVLAAIGLSAPLWNSNARRHGTFLIGLFVCSFLALCPGAYFRPHYFILLLPVAAILVGVSVRTATEWIAEKRTHAALTVIPVLIFAFSFGYAVIHQRQSYFSMDPLSVFQATYPDSPFVAATKVSAYVRQNSSEATFIAVLGSEPEIYFYAKRHSAISYIYMYSLIVRQKYTARMREEMLLQLQTSKPEYLVYVDAWDSWGDRQGGPELAAFLSALHEFMDGNYERVGLADMGETTAYIWGDGAKSYSPLSSEAIYILKRRQPASATPLPSG